MNKEQIEKYEYCKNHITIIDEIVKNLPFGFQQYGCGSARPNIEHTLERVHNEMYRKVIEAIKEAKAEVQTIIDKT